MKQLTSHIWSCYSPQKLLFASLHGRNLSCGVGIFIYLLHSFCLFNCGACVDVLAKSEFISLRSLNRLFHVHVGIGPKSFIRIVRFQKALQALDQRLSTRRLAEIAQAPGLADESSDRICF
ncbi:MAG: AraC family transcriptional regulator [Peptococcaceae bacterium]|nr:AraC family transcriptional regulator [Peptococcaceae bacterium]